MTGIRIDQLTPFLPAATRDMLLAAMENGVTGSVTVGQLLDLIIGTAPDTYDTLQEIAAWIDTHGDEYQALLVELATKLARDGSNWNGDAAAQEAFRAAIGVDDRFGPSLAAPLDPVYYTKSQVMFNRLDEMAMCGHFYKGQWSKARGKIFAAPPENLPGQALANLGNGNSTQGDLLYEAWASLDVWYNLWAVANDGDATFSYKFTPSIWIGTVNTSTGVITFNSSGENEYPHTTPSAKTFQFATNALVGVEVLKITGTVAGRPGAWLGKKATIIANDGNSITLDDASDLTMGDVIKILPSTYDHYNWLFDLYGEDNLDNTISIRNIGTRTNGERMAYMVTMANEFPAAGVSVPGPPGTKVHWGACISPLARTMVCNADFIASLSSAGTYAEYFDMDGAHIPESTYGEKFQTTSAQRFPFRGMKVAGSYGPYFFFKNGGNNVANIITHGLHVLGWYY